MSGKLPPLGCEIQGRQRRINAEALLNWIDLPPQWPAQLKAIGIA
jgi:hypothetical protein